jgi:polyphosphate kinase
VSQHLAPLTECTVPDAAIPDADSAVPAVPPAPPAATSVPPATDLPEDRYLNRELSWLDFNARVLALAEDTSQPLLERVKFVAIFASNQDEFSMVRVAGLKRREEAGLAVRSPDGLSLREQLAQIAMRSRELAERQTRIYHDSIRPELEKHEIIFVTWVDLAHRQRLRLSDYFTAHIFPVLTPLAVDPAHPIPSISS